MKNLKYGLFSILVLFVLTFIYLVAYNLYEPKAYDFMIANVNTQKLSFDKKKNVDGHDDIVLVVIDNKAVQNYRWPWKRELHSKVYGYFQEYAKPKVIVQDLLIAALDPDNPQSDRKFFNSVSKFNNLIGGFLAYEAFYDEPQKGENYEEKFIKKYEYKNITEKTLPSSFLYSLMLFPDPYFDILKYTGFVNLYPGFLDKSFKGDLQRTQEYFMNYKGHVFPSLSMAAFLYINNNPKVEITKNYIKFPELNYKIRHKMTKYQMIIPRKFYKAYNYDSTFYSHKKYSAVDIITSYENLKQGKAPIYDPEIFKDKIIVYGACATADEGLNDIKETPVLKRHPGVDVQASGIDNLVHNDYLIVLPKWLNILLTILCMFFVCIIINRYEFMKAIVYTILLIFGYLFLCAICYYYDIVINVLTPVVMFITATIFAYINRYLTESRNKEKVKNALSKYMSEDVMKNVLKNIDNLGLGGKKSVVTVLFSDIRGFTSLSENMTAQQVSELLNEYFSEMEPIVTKYNGIINKFIGDAVMAVFGEPIQDGNHPLNAVKSGWEMLKKVEELNEKWQTEGRNQIHIGIGINTGDVFIGNIGSENRMEYTVIGDTVNLASRLESYNKVYNTKMLISVSTYEFSKNAIFVNEIENVEIRGKSEKMNIYEVTSVEKAQ